MEMYAQFKELVAPYWNVSPSTYYKVVQPSLSGNSVWLEMDDYGSKCVPVQCLNFSSIVDLEPKPNSQEIENEIFSESHPNHPATQYFEGCV